MVVPPFKFAPLSLEEKQQNLASDEDFETAAAAVKVLPRHQNAEALGVVCVCS